MSKMTCGILSTSYSRVDPPLTSYALNRTYASENRQGIRILLATSGVGWWGISMEVSCLQGLK